MNNGLYRRFLDKMKLNGNYDEDEEYDGYDDDEEEDVTPKVRNSRKKNDDIFSSSKNNTDDDDFGDLEEKIIKSTDTRPVKPARVSRNSSASRGSSKNSSSKVVSMQGKFNPMEVCVIKPTNVEDGREIAETLLSGRAVILNLEGLDMELAQRIIDFSGGACFAIDGKLKKYLIIYLSQHLHPYQFPAIYLNCFQMTYHSEQTAVISDARK